MKYHLISLGCQMNISDSERVVSILNEMGMERTEDEEEASLLGVVACSVRQKAIDRVYSRISKWNKWKKRKPLLTFVSGCILPADREKFLKLFDIVFPMNELSELPDMIKQYGVVTPMGIQTSSGISDTTGSMDVFWKITPQYNSAFEAFVPIQNGCDKFCSFCAVPYTRGREVSRPSAEIVGEVRSLIGQGYKSITLLGQNVNSYGLDKKGEEILFPELLRKIGEMGKQSGQEFWTYFTSPHPRDMVEEVIDVIASYPVLAKQLHLPLQSGDDRMLIRMNRKYKVEEYRKVVQYIRKKLPSATLFTDIITGFSGETEEQFANTLEVVKEFKYNMAFIATYSPRPGAVSSRWEDDIPLAIKKQRLHALNAEVESYSHEYNRNLVGKTLRVLVTGKDLKGEYLAGLTEGKVNVRITSSDMSLVGSFIDVQITGATEFSLAANPVLIETLEEIV
jgi:tRNA-2-methylthio-N6-dimethylallyladenosine synthase